MDIKGRQDKSNHIHSNQALPSPVLTSKMLMEFGSLASKAARTPEETRKLLIEFENRLRGVEEVEGRPVDAMHAKSILIAILDPATRQHTAVRQRTAVHGTGLHLMASRQGPGAKQR